MNIFKKSNNNSLNDELLNLENPIKRDNKLNNKSTSLKELRKNNQNNTQQSSQNITPVINNLSSQNIETLNNQLNQLPNDFLKLDIQKSNLKQSVGNSLNQDFINGNDNSDNRSIMGGSESGSDIDFDLQDFENNI